MADEGATKRTARAVFQTIQARQNAVNNTLNALANRPGLPPELVDAIADFRIRFGAITSRTQATWAEVSQGGTPAAQKKAAELQTRRSQRAAQKQAAEQQAASAPAPNQPQFRARVAELEEELRAIDEEARQVQEAVDRARRDADASLDQPNAPLEGMARELDALQREANALLAEASGRENARSAWQGVEPNREALKEAIEFHKTEAKASRNAMFMLGAAVVLLLLETAMRFDVVAVNDYGLALFIAARVGFASLLAGLIVFMGRLHSRHVRQGVIYQEKLVDLDVVRMVVENANAETIRGIVQQMARTYLRAEAHGFVDAHEDADASWRAARRLAKQALALQNAIGVRRAPRREEQK